MRDGSCRTFGGIKRVLTRAGRPARERKRPTPGARKQRIEQIRTCKRRVACNDAGWYGYAIVIYVQNRVWLASAGNIPSAISGELAGQSQGVELFVGAQNVKHVGPVDDR